MENTEIMLDNQIVQAENPTNERTNERRRIACLNNQEHLRTSLRS